MGQNTTSQNTAITNTAIKRYMPAITGETLELFASKHARLPVVAKILQSPWVSRASELMDVSGDAGGASVSKRLSEPVRVIWDVKRQAPYAFIRESGASARTVSRHQPFTGDPWHGTRSSRGHSAARKSSGCQLPCTLPHSRIYYVEAVVQVWIAQRSWWEAHGEFSRVFWRVIANDGAYDLAYDRQSACWLLIGIED